MTGSRTVAVVAVLVVLVLAGCAAPEPPAPPVDTKPQIDPAFEAEVRWLIHCTGAGCGGYKPEAERQKLLQHGENAFPVYEAILADPKTDDRTVALTCMAITRVKVDRRRFVPLLMKRITAADAMFVECEKYRWQSILGNREEQARYRTQQEASARDRLANLLVEIGDQREAVALAPYLDSKTESLRRVAARVLSVFGSQADLDAMNSLLKRGIPGADGHELRDLTQCRDELAKRLKEHPVPTTLTN